MCVQEPGQGMSLSEGLSPSLAAQQEATLKRMPADFLAVPASPAARVFLHDTTATDTESQVSATAADTGSQVSAVTVTSCCCISCCSGVFCMTQSC